MAMDITALHQQFKLFPFTLKDEWPEGFSYLSKSLVLMEARNPELTLWFTNQAANGFYEYRIFPAGERDSTSYLALYTGFSGVRVLSLVDRENRIGSDKGYSYHILWNGFTGQVTFVVDEDATIWSHSSQVHLASRSTEPFNDAVFALLREKLPPCMERNIPADVVA